MSFSPCLWVPLLNVLIFIAPSQTVHDMTSSWVLPKCLNQLSVSAFRLIKGVPDNYKGFVSPPPPSAWAQLDNYHTEMCTVSPKMGTGSQVIHSFNLGHYLLWAEIQCWSCLSLPHADDLRILLYASYSFLLLLLPGSTYHVHSYPHSNAYIKLQVEAET